MLTIVYHDDESARECRRSICVAIRGAVYKLVCAFATWQPKYINKQHHVLGAYVIAKQQNKKKQLERIFNHLKLRFVGEV